MAIIEMGVTNIEREKQESQRGRATLTAYSIPVKCGSLIIFEWWPLCNEKKNTNIKHNFSNKSNWHS